jgi:hypothetical protein
MNRRALLTGLIAAPAIVILSSPALAWRRTYDHEHSRRGCDWEQTGDGTYEYPVNRHAPSRGFERFDHNWRRCGR